MPDKRKATISFTDTRNPEKVEGKLIDIIQLGDTFKAQSRDKQGTFIHAAPDGRIHADVYLGTQKMEVKVQITGSIVITGTLAVGTSIPISPGQTFGFAGYSTGPSGQIGTLIAHVSGTSLALSSNEQVFGTIFVGTTLGAYGSASQMLMGF